MNFSFIPNQFPNASLQTKNKDLQHSLIMVRKTEILQNVNDEILCGNIVFKFYKFGFITKQVDQSTF